MLFMEEATAGVSNLTGIQTSFQNYLPVGIDILADAVNETAPRVAELLNDTLVQVMLFSLAC